MTITWTVILCNSNSVWIEQLHNWSVGLDDVTSAKVEFLWRGTVGQLGRHVLVLSDCVIRASDEAWSYYWLGAEHEASGSDGFPTSSISHFVDQYTAAALIHAFITGRLDYCNGLLAGTPRVVTDVYQNVQNAAARLLAGHGHGKTSGRHGLRQVMRDELHWLRVVYLRIKNY